MKKLLIVAATALGVAFGGLAPVLAAPATSSTATYQVAQAAKKDEAPAKGKKTKKKGAGKKKAASDSGEPKAKKKAKGKKKADEKKS